MSQKNFIPSVFSTLKVLEFLADKKNQNCTLSEISKGLSINKTTCLRILKTLQKKDFIHYDEDSKRYKLGSYLISLGSRAKEVNDYIKVAISYLPVLCEEVGETVVLAKPTDPYNMFYIATEEPNEKIRITASTGENFPIIAGATGKAYMAYLPKERINEIIEEYILDGSLPKYTENTITNPQEFIESINEVRQKGVAETHSEHTRGIYAIACPIFNSKGEVVLSIGVFIQSMSPGHINISKIRDEVKKYAEIISHQVSRFI